MKKPSEKLISVVTVCRNVRNDLEKTMKSVLSQTADNFEFVIVDGNSTDGTRELLEGVHDPRVKWVSERDNGIYDAMNKGTRLSSGEWVIFMNARREALLRHPFDLRHPLSADFKFFKTLIRGNRGFHRMDFPVSIFDTTGISNRRRSEGLADNMKVICDVDGFFRGFPLLARLLPTFAIARFRGK